MLPGANGFAGQGHCSRVCRFWTAAYRAIDDLAPGASDTEGHIRSDTYPIGYTADVMDAGELLGRIRVSSGLTQEELAHLAGTSRPTLSAYERGRKSPTVATFARLLSRAGWELAAQPHVSFTEQASARGKPNWIPDRLPRLEVARALAAVELPLHLNWSTPGRYSISGHGPTGRGCTRSCCRKEHPPTSLPTSTAHCSSTCGKTSSCRRV